MTDAIFSLLDELPRRRLALEASAGTGKTFTLAGLATRLLAETSVNAADLLVVTFTRAATAELRARIRDRLVEAAHHLAHDEPPPTSDEILAHLADCEHDERRLRRERLERAVTDFDSATITTIHGFATQVLTTLGLDAGIDAEATLTDDADVLIADACADVLVTAAGDDHTAEVLPTLDQLTKHVTALLSIPDLDIAPEPGTEGTADPATDLLVELVRRARDTIEHRRRRDGTMSFDDILTKLREALDPSRPGHAIARTALRNRFRVALIDEFQDTDPVQWDIFSALFADDTDPSGPPDPSDPLLVLVGDPKQAIYAFRGANIHTYLSAVATTTDDERRSLGTNWRSDGAVITSLEVLLDGTTFGDDAIAFQHVDTPEEHRDQRMTRTDGTPLPALSIRLGLGTGIARKNNDIKTRSGERSIYRDLVAGVRELLDDAVIPDPASEGGTRRVHPGDIAVLVRMGIEATTIQQELTEQGIPAVLSRGSVLESPAAEQWRWLLSALQRPSDPRRARTAALSWFGGRDADWVASASDEELATFQEQLVEWADTLTNHGVIAFVRKLWADSQVMARVLAMRDGDRNITDLDHIGELLQTTAGPGGASVAGLLTALDFEPDANPDADLDSDLVARRIESEAEAVKIMTVWVSKGLQFPIVCVPTMWRPRSPGRIYLDPITKRRTLDVDGGDWPDKDTAKDRKRRMFDEGFGENLRLLYVALTRAQHHTMLWWTRPRGSSNTGLSRVLFARTADGLIDPKKFASERWKCPANADEAVAILETVAARSKGTLDVRVHGISLRPADRWTPPGTTTLESELSVATLDHRPDRSLHRWSFTAISSKEAMQHADPYDPSGSDRGASDEAGPDGLEPGADLDLTEPVLSRRSGTSDTDLRDRTSAPVSPLASLPAGTGFGTFVHSVFEHVDFAADDLPAALQAALDEQRMWRAVDLTPVVGADADPDAPAPTSEDGDRLLVEGLDTAIRTPLGPLVGGRTLSDFSTADRLDELDFQLRLGGDGVDGRAATDRDIGALLLRHLPADDPLHDWAASLAEGAFNVELAGHLTGSIDAVLQVRSDDGPPRFVVVDYKTNRLHAFGEEPKPGDYGPAGLTAAMVEHHYPLQILLYSVALHRYLRWRLAGYDPAVHLGGAAYLFVRGMTGPEVPTTDGHPDGVFSWAVPPALVEELSDLLDGRVGASDLEGAVS